MDNPVTREDVETLRAMLRERVGRPATSPGDSRKAEAERQELRRKRADIRRAVEMPELRSLLSLVRHGVPWDVAASLTDDEMAAFNIIMGQFDGAVWDWDRWQWEPEPTGSGVVTTEIHIDGSKINEWRGRNG